LRFTRWMLLIEWRLSIQQAVSGNLTSPAEVCLESREGQTSKRQWCSETEWLKICFGQFTCVSQSLCWSSAGNPVTGFRFRLLTGWFVLTFGCSEIGLW